MPRYMPILPTVLINGAEGIGTGWSTSVPNYNPRDVVDNIKRLLDGEVSRSGRRSAGLDADYAGASAAEFGIRKDE